MTISEREPGADCPLCPRLAEFRHQQRITFPDWYNAPVPSFGAAGARLVIVGLAPGLKGANRTGRPFTGDYAGDLLYATLEKFGFAEGKYGASAHDGLTLPDCLITNAVRCVPPQNKPLPAETRTCNAYLSATLQHARPKAILALGRIAHDAVLDALALRRGAYRFAHGAHHGLLNATLVDSYHCSRYNTNTGRLTTEMFEDVFAAIKRTID